MNFFNKYVIVSFAMLLTVLSSCKSKKMIVSDGAEVVNANSSDGFEGSTISQSNEGVVLTFESDVLFPTNSSYLTEKAKVTMKNMVAYINKNYPQSSIKINGHTDSTGEKEYNQWLSEKRAVSVKGYAVSLGLADSRISTQGFGVSKPVASNSTSDGRQKNRRVEVVILK